jgi:hypothetical protein
MKLPLYNNINSHYLSYQLLDSLWPLSTPKANIRGEAFLHTSKVSTNPFHNRYGITLTSPHTLGLRLEQRQLIFSVDRWT